MDIYCFTFNSYPLVLTQYDDNYIDNDDNDNETQTGSMIKKLHTHPLPIILIRLLVVCGWWRIVSDWGWGRGKLLVVRISLICISSSKSSSCLVTLWWWCRGGRWW